MELYVDDVAKWLVANESAIMAAASTAEREAVRCELTLNIEALSIYALKLMGDGDIAAAQRVLAVTINILDEYIHPCHYYYLYIAGVLRMKGGQLSSAENSFRRFLSIDIAETNELAWFYLGNVCYCQGRGAEAIEAYDRAISYRPSFREAIANRQAATLGERLPFAEAHLELDECRLEDYLDIPIFINSRDRVGCLRSLVDWLLAAGHRRIIILDNDSSYPPLLDYYQSLTGHPAVMVLYLHGNFGHRAIWDLQILEKMNIRTPYVYTDSDVVPDDSCPQDLVRRLLLGLKRYPWLDKCGVRLRTDDIANEFYREWEQKYNRLMIDNDFFCAPTDTTFALYNCRHYSLDMAVRTRGEYAARHLPWYYIEDNIPPDESYYRKHANSSSTLAKIDKGVKVVPTDGHYYGFFV